MKTINRLKIKALLIERGLKVKDLVPILGKTRTSVSNRMMGQVQFTPNELGIIASWLGCSIDEFYSDSDKPS